VTVARDSIRGDGTRFTLMGNATTPARPVAIDSIAAMESYRDVTNRRKSALVSVVVSVLIVGFAIIDLSRSGFALGQ
jgi:hypothetical protein